MQKVPELYLRLLANQVRKNRKLVRKLAKASADLIQEKYQEDHPDVMEDPDEFNYGACFDSILVTIDQTLKDIAEGTCSSSK